MTLKEKIIYGIPATATVTLMGVAPALADGTANAEVVSAFTSAAGEVKATVLAIAGVSVTILVVMYAFKWGKKIFNRVAS